MREHTIVAIGGSAGSLEPLKAFFKHAPLDRASYIILRHMPKDWQSQLKSLLDRYAVLEVEEATDGITVEPNKVYIAPTHKHVIIRDKKLHLLERSEGPNRAIDLFFDSLVQEGLGASTIAVILSGVGFGGVKGAEAIKRAGGLVIAQDPQTAEHDTMPAYTIKADIVDWVAAPSQMPAIILSYVKEKQQTQ